MAQNQSAHKAQSPDEVPLVRGPIASGAELATNDNATDPASPDEAPDSGGSEESSSAPPSPSTQDDTERISDSQNADLSPPALVTKVDAEYPADAKIHQIEADVELLLTIDASGRVTAASADGVVLRRALTGATEGGITTSSSSKPTEPAQAEPSEDSLIQAFSNAAEEAAAGFSFTPARRGQTSIAARIRYLYEFRLPASQSSERVAPALSASFVVVAPVVASLPPEAPPPDETQSESSEPQAHEVHIQGKRLEQEMRESAESVKVVQFEQTRKETSDMGEILARTPGVSIQRTGGLGKGSRVSLNGFGGDRVRIYVDGVPLEYSGYPMDIADFPVNIVERVEIYSGIVPVRFGKDALGGVINIVTNRGRSSRIGASYQVGSFGTHRSTLSAYKLFKPTGFFLGSSLSYDYSDNDYPIYVEIPNNVGRLSPATVHRFNDEYGAYTHNIETGWLERPWAQQLVLRGFFSNVEQGIQNRGGRTVPYGSPHSSQQNSGTSLAYTHEFGKERRWSVDAISGYTYTKSHLLDVDPCLYNWYRQCVREFETGGELNRGSPTDSTTSWHAFYTRAQLGWEFSENNQLLLALSPDYTESGTANSRRFTTTSTEQPNIDLDNHTVALVTGIEYLLRLFEGRLENRAFFKYWVQQSYAESLRQTEQGVFIRNPDGSYAIDTVELLTSSDPGFGDGLRYRITDWLYAKAAYERATRAPTHEELFGDGLLVLGNPALEPEGRHAFNWGLGVRADTPSGAWRGEATGFVRLLDNTIVSMPIGPESRFTRSDNLYTANSTGVELSAGWTAPERWLVFDMNGTYQDYRNTSSEGLFADFQGDRIPNTPYLFFNIALRLQQQKVFSAQDQLALTSYLRYVHEYYLGWEDVGRPDTKVIIPSYLLPTVGLVYTMNGDRARFSSSIEIQNVTDSNVVDVYGLQRPGRAIYAKMTLDTF